jgi:hypothetical protein
MDVIRAALTGGAIKLQGPNSNDYNAQNIKADSDYLNGLINSVAKNLLENANK